jgi:hypothetical protein
MESILTGCFKTRVLDVFLKEGRKEWRERGREEGKERGGKRRKEGEGEGMEGGRKEWREGGGREEGRWVFAYFTGQIETVPCQAGTCQCPTSYVLLWL